MQFFTFFPFFPTQQFNSGKKGTRSMALLNSKWAVLRFLVTDSCHATALLHKFCTWFLAFICEFVLFVDVEQHSLLARFCFMFCFISNDVFVSIRNVELRPIGNDYCVGPISMKRWTKNPNFG